MTTSSALLIAGGIFTLDMLLTALWLSKRGDVRHTAIALPAAHLMLLVSAVLLVVVLSYEPLRSNPDAKDAALIWLYGTLCGGIGLRAAGLKLHNKQADTANTPEAGNGK